MEEEEQTFKRANMADEEEVCSTNEKEAPTGDNEQVAQPRTNIEETSLPELKEMLVTFKLRFRTFLKETQSDKRGGRTAECIPSAEDRIKAMKQQDDLET